MTKKSLQNSIRVRPKELEEFIAARLKRRPYRRKETAQSARGWRRRRVSRDGSAAVPIGVLLQRTESRRQRAQGIGPTAQGGGVVRSCRCSTKVFTFGEMWRALGYTTCMGVDGASQSRRTRSSRPPRQGASTRTAPSLTSPTGHFYFAGDRPSLLCFDNSWNPRVSGIGPSSQERKGVRATGRPALSAAAPAFIAV
jgi:hypothetical protein